MHPGLKPYFDLVWPLFWPWLIWNLVRFARWHERTGLNALLSVDCFGNIRIVQMCDLPPAEDFYSYVAPEVPRWELAAFKPLSLGRGVGVRGDRIAASSALAESPRPLIPNPFS